MQLDLSFASPVDRRSVYASEGRRRAFALLSEGFGAGPGFLLLTGAPGTGKTLLLADALTSWSEGVPLAWLTASSLNRDPLTEIAMRFGIPADGAQEPGTAFERFLAGVGGRGERALLAVDDAHELSGDALDTLILLAEFEHEGRRPLHVLLVGRTELDERVAGPECEALRERIAVQCRLDPLAEQETERYLRLRVANGSGAASAPSRAISLVIHALGAGNPRAIDRLVDEAMRRYAVPSPGGLSEAQLRASAAFLAGQEPPAEVAAEAERSAPESDAPAAPATAAPGRPMADVGPARGIGASSHAEVKEWVSRFVGEQGPPKIGARLAFDAIEAEVNRHEQRMAVLEFSPRPAVEGSDDAVNGTAAEEAPAEEMAELPLPARRPAPQRASSRSRRGKPRMVPYTIAAVLGLLLAAILLLPRVRTLLPSLGAKPAVQDSTPNPARNTSSQGLGAPTGSASTSPAIVLTPSKPSAVVAPADTAKPAPVWRGLEVATYLSADRAHEEQQRLSSLTGLSGQVLTGTEDGADVFRVVLGQYRSRSRAEKAAAWLLNDGYVTQARTIRIEPPPNIE